MTKTSHKQNRPFDFKLIDLVEPYPVLYQRQGSSGFSTYEYMKVKTEIWKEIATKMGTDVQFCISRWGNLRGQFQKELRQCRYVCPKLGIIKDSTWPYLKRLQFLENTVEFNRLKRKRVKNGISREEECEWNRDFLSDENKSRVKHDNKEDENMAASITVEKEEGVISAVQRLTALLNGIDNGNRVRVERRIMAFLCKCQLKALIKEDVCDLCI